MQDKMSKNGYRGIIRVLDKVDLLKFAKGEKVCWFRSNEKQTRKWRRDGLADAIVKG